MPSTTSVRLPKFRRSSGAVPRFYAHETRGSVSGAIGAVDGDSPGVAPADGRGRDGVGAADEVCVGPALDERGERADGEVHVIAGRLGEAQRQLLAPARGADATPGGGNLNEADIAVPGCGGGDLGGERHAVLAAELGEHAARTIGGREDEIRERAARAGDARDGERQRRRRVGGQRCVGAPERAAGAIAFGDVRDERGAHVVGGAQGPRADLQRARGTRCGGRRRARGEQEQHDGDGSHRDEPATVAAWAACLRLAVRARVARRRRGGCRRDGRARLRLRHSGSSQAQWLRGLALHHSLRFEIERFSDRLSLGSGLRGEGLSLGSGGGVARVSRAAGAVSHSAGRRNRRGSPASARRAGGPGRAVPGACPTIM